MSVWIIRVAEYSTPVAWIAFGVMLLCCGCQRYKGELPDGGKYIESGIRVNLPGDKIDIPIISSRERVLSPDEFKEKLDREAEQQRQVDEIEAEKRERLFSVESKEERRKVLIWLSAVSYTLAVFAVVAGVLLKGYKTFGMLSGALMILGTVFLSLVTTIHVLSWGLVGAVVIAVLRLLYLLKERGYGGD